MIPELGSTSNLENGTGASLRSEIAAYFGTFQLTVNSDLAKMHAVAADQKENELRE